MPKIKFTGFNIEDSERATTVNCEEADLMLLMPCLSNSYVRDVENREVVEVKQTAVVVDIVAA